MSVGAVGGLFWCWFDVCCRPAATWRGFPSPFMVWCDQHVLGSMYYYYWCITAGVPGSKGSRLLLSAMLFVRWVQFL